MRFVFGVLVLIIGGLITCKQRNQIDGQQGPDHDKYHLNNLINLSPLDVDGLYYLVEGVNTAAYNPLSHNQPLPTGHTTLYDSFGNPIMQVNMADYNASSAGCTRISSYRSNLWSSKINSSNYLCRVKLSNKTTDQPRTPVTLATRNSNSCMLPLFHADIKDIGVFKNFLEDIKDISVENTETYGLSFLERLVNSYIDEGNNEINCYNVSYYLRLITILSLKRKSLLAKSKFDDLLTEALYVHAEQSCFFKASEHFTVKDKEEKIRAMQKFSSKDLRKAGLMSWDNVADSYIKGKCSYIIGSLLLYKLAMDEKSRR